MEKVVLLSRGLDGIYFGPKITTGIENDATVHMEQAGS